MIMISYRTYIMKILKPFFSDVKVWFICDALCCILIKFFATLIPVFYGIFIDKVILASNISYLLIVILGYFGAQLLISIFKFGNLKCFYIVKNKVFKRVRLKALEQYLSMRFDQYPTLSSGDVKMVMEDDVEKLSVFAEKQTIEWGLNLVYSCVLIVTLLCIDWRLALLACISIPLTLYLDYIVSKRESGVNDILNTNDAEWGTWLDETIKSFKEIRVNQLANTREAEFTEYQKVDEKYFSSWLRCWVTRTLVIPKIKDDFIMKFLLYFIGGILIYKRYFTIGTLLIFVQYYGMLADTIKDLSKANADLQSDKPYIERILTRISDVDDILVDGDKNSDTYDITLDHVTFKYEDLEVIKDFSLVIREGERIGIMGASGTGKSTLLKLLLGIVQPQAGSIKYGGIELHEINKMTLYKKISYISQESIVFNASVLENLLMGNPDASMHEVEVACKKACIDNFINSLPMKYDTVIGENGSSISGGQKQRLLLARAFLRNSNIYIFDEITSALDGIVEEEIREVIENISKEKTIIIVSHKDTLLKVCNRVIKIKD